MTKRELVVPYLNRSYGIIGEETGYYNRKVGDIVVFRVEEKIHTSVVVKTDGMYALLGFPGYSLDSNYFKDMSILVPSKKLQERNLKQHNMSMLEIRNVDVEEEEEMETKVVKRLYRDPMYTKGVNEATPFRGTIGEVVVDTSRQFNGKSLVNAATIHVGDIVCYSYKDERGNIRSTTGLVTKNVISGEGTFACVTEYQPTVLNVENMESLRVVVPFTMLTPEILKLNPLKHVIKEEEEIKMLTLSDIERELGYKFKLVREEDE